MKEKILIVGDGADGLFNCLTSSGILTLEADDIAGAQRALSTGQVAVTVVNASRLARDPGSVVREIRELSPETEVIILSEETEGQKVLAALRAGVADYIITPSVTEELEVRVRTVLARHRVRAERAAELLRLGADVGRLQRAIDEARERARMSFFSTCEALDQCLQAKHAYTEGHSIRVAARSIQTARLLGLSEREIEIVEVAGLFHDIGKIGLRDNVLNKPGRLTEEEYEHVKTHPLVAERILAPVDEFRDILPSIKHEHERYDGRGYPSGLRGEAIPVGARLIAIADAYDAMTFDRIYHEGVGHDAAMEEVRRCAGTQFDPDLVDAFVRVMGEKQGVFRYGG